ncbi:MAG: sulfatase-like hydrolase/transferase, partial [Acidobacteriia bacterium]|nr:sulfatase-like hydrolase/transferase [Terriglobia bacterium]
MILSRRELLRTAGAAPLAARAAAGRLNVLMIAVDDLNNRLGCYGDHVVQSPNIDRLAARGARFDSAYCNYPLCNPSRTSLLSGRRPDTTRIFDNTTPPRTHLGNVVMLPEHFRANGYFTGRVGKIAHGAFEDAVSWDVSEFASGRRPGATARKKGGAGAAGRGANNLVWEATNNSDAEEPDGRTARRIVQLMEEKRDKPFFLGCGFHKP